MNVVRRLLQNVGLAQQESSSEESESSISSESQSEGDESSVQETLSDREFSRGDKVEAKIPNVTYEYKAAEILKYDYGKGGDGKFTIKFLHNNYVVHEIRRHHLRSIREQTLIASGSKFSRGHRIEARQYKKRKMKVKKKLTAKEAILRKHKKRFLQGKEEKDIDDEGDSSSSSSSGSGSSSSGDSSSSSGSDGDDDDEDDSSSEDEEERREREMAINKNRMKEHPEYEWKRCVVLKSTIDAETNELAYLVRWKGTFFEDVVKESHCRVLFRKGDEVEVKAEGFADYYKATVIKVRRDENTYDLEVEEDGEIVQHCIRERIREVGSTIDLIGRAVNDKYQQKRREYVQALKTRNYEKMYDMIVEEGMHPDFEDPLTGTNALIRACLSGKHKWAVKFVEEGADVNYQSLSSLTPLIACAEKGSLRCAKVIMFDPFDRPLANPWKRNRAGKTAWDVAKEYKKKNIVDYLDSVIERPGYKEALRNYTVVGNSTVDLKKQAEIMAKNAARQAALALKNTPIVRNGAATKIQRWIRKVLNRVKFQYAVQELIMRRRRQKHKEALEAKKLVHLSILATKVQRRYRGRLARRRYLKLCKERDAAMILQRLLLRYISRRRGRLRFEREHREFLNYMAVKIQKTFRGYVAYRDYNELYESVLVIQMLWRGNNARDMYLKKLLERERVAEFRRQHMREVERMKRITKELYQHLFVEQAKQKVQATRVIEKYFVYWLFLKRRLNSTIVIQKWWRGYVARHIYAVLRRLDRERMVALERSIHIKKLHPKMSPSKKKTPTRFRKEYRDNSPSLRPKMIATPSLQSIFYAGLDSKLVKKMVGETTNITPDASKTETPPPPAPSIKIPLMEHQKPLAAQWDNSPVQKSIRGTNKRKIKEYFAPNHQKASSPYGKVARVQNVDEDSRAKRLLVRRYPKSRRTLKKKSRKSAKRKLHLNKRQKTTFNELMNRAKNVELSFHRRQDKAIKRFPGGSKTHPTESITLSKASCTTTLSGSAVLAKNKKVGRNSVATKRDIHDIEGQNAMQRQLKRQPTVQVKVRKQTSSPTRELDDGKSKSIEKDLFKLLKEKKKQEMSRPSINQSRVFIQKKQLVRYRKRRKDSSKIEPSPEKTNLDKVDEKDTAKHPSVSTRKQSMEPADSSSALNSNYTRIRSSSYRKKEVRVIETLPEPAKKSSLSTAQKPSDSKAVVFVETKRAETPETNIEREKGTGVLIKPPTKRLVKTPNAFPLPKLLTSPHPLVTLRLVKDPKYKVASDKRPDTAEEDRITPRNNLNKDNTSPLAIINIDSLEFSIGRDASNNCTLDSIRNPKMLSKTHAQIRIEISRVEPNIGKPMIQLLDMNSTNGTYIKKQGIETSSTKWIKLRKQPFHLANGQVIKFGRKRSSDLIYEVDVSPSISYDIARLISQTRISSPLGKVRFGQLGGKPSLDAGRHRSRRKIKTPLSPQRLRSLSSLPSLGLTE